MNSEQDAGIKTFKKITQSVYDDWFGRDSSCWKVSQMTNSVQQFNTINDLNSCLEEKRIISLDFPIELFIAKIGNIQNILYSLRDKDKRLDVYFRTSDYYSAIQIYYERKYLFWYELIKNMKSNKENVFGEILDTIKVTALNTSYSYIDFFAERRNPNSISGLNGYYIVSKYGAIMRDKYALCQLNALLTKHNKQTVESLHELVASADGLNFWQEFGFGFSGRICF